MTDEVKDNKDTNNTKFKKPTDYKEQPNLAAELVDTTKTNSQLEAEAIALEMEYKRQEMEYRRQEMEFRKVDIELKKEEHSKLLGARAAKMQLALDKKMATLQFLAARKASQDRCNHRKGGMGADAVMRGMGQDGAYAVIKHRLPHREFMVLCQRCGKEWHPANKWNVENGEIKPLPASEGWAEAMNYPSDNSPSASSDFAFQEVKL
jgi:hypothetical protein